MKLPSISQIWADLHRTFLRFPMTVLGALVVTTVAITLIEHEGPDQPSILFSILLSGIVSLPLMTALKLTAESEVSGSGRRWGWQAIGVVLIVAYAFTVPTDLPRAPVVHLFRFLAFAVAALLALSYLPFRRQGHAHGFWEYNRALIFRTIIAGAFAVVLFAGLGLALAALDNLFGMDIPTKRYPELWVLILGLFAVPFVLSGIPEDLNNLDQAADYPRSLRIFGQYVLPPLVVVYFVILYAYIAKIVITWNWPQGWVGRLILGFSATGILALFVLNPLREKRETLWLQKASRWYYLILLPLIAVLFLALWRRISEYGLTESRYLGVALCVWLAFIAGYFLLSRSKSIKMIPASLCVLVLLISVGPWGMFSVSERNQVERLKATLETNSILVEGRIQKAPSPISTDDQARISGILSYLHEVHGFSAIEPWFAENLRADSADAGSRFKSPNEIADLMGIEFNPYWRPERERYFVVSVNLQTPIATAGYDHLVRAEYNGAAAKADPGKTPSTTEVISLADSVILRFTDDSDDSTRSSSEANPSITIPLRPLIDRIVTAHDATGGRPLSGDDATSEFETADARMKIVMIEGHFARQEDTVVVNSYYSALIFYSRGDER